MGHPESDIYDEENIDQPDTSNRRRLYDPKDPSFKDEKLQSPHSDRPQPNLTLNDGDRYKRVISPKSN